MNEFTLLDINKGSNSSLQTQSVDSNYNYFSDAIIIIYEKALLQFIFLSCSYSNARFAMKSSDEGNKNANPE